MTRQDKHGDSKGKRMAIPKTHVRFPRVSRPERVARAARCKGSSVIMWFVAVRSGTRDPRGLENLLQDCQASSATGRNRGIPGNWTDIGASDSVVCADKQETNKPFCDNSSL